VLPPGVYQIGSCACTKTAHILKVSGLIVFCPFVACLLIELENNSFLLKEMLWAHNFSCSKKTVPQLTEPSKQLLSCTVNDWDTWFYSAYVVASELPVPKSCWLLCLECATRTCLLHQGWQCGWHETAHCGWMGSYHSIIASGLPSALPVDILSIVCSAIIHFS